MTANRMPDAFPGVAPSVAVIAIVLGATVVTGGAETVAAKFPSASATVLPNAPPPIETEAPGVKPDPVTGTGAPETKHPPRTAIADACAAAGATSAPATPAAAAIRSFMPSLPPERDDRIGCRGRRQSPRLLPSACAGEPGARARPFPSVQDATDGRAYRRGHERSDDLPGPALPRRTGRDRMARPRVRLRAADGGRRPRRHGRPRRARLRWGDDHARHGAPARRRRVQRRRAAAGRHRAVPRRRGPRRPPRARPRGGGGDRARPAGHRLRLARVLRPRPRGQRVELRDLPARPPVTAEGYGGAAVSPSARPNTVRRSSPRRAAAIAPSAPGRAAAPPASSITWP